MVSKKIIAILVSLLLLTMTVIFAVAESEMYEFSIPAGDGSITYVVDQTGNIHAEKKQ